MQRVTIVDVARRASVAISSASAALNDRPGVSDLTRQRVKEAAQELGYTPSLRAKSLSSKKSFALGLVVERSPEVLETDPFFASFLGGVEEVLADSDYALVLEMGRNRADTEERYRQLAADRRVDGVFLSELEVDDYRVPLLEELQMPAVALNPDVGDFPFPAVRQNGRNAIERLVEHLALLGHRRFAHVAGPAAYIHSRQRRDAWCDALRRRGLPTGPIVQGKFTYASGVAAADTLLGGSAERPTAVFCANDLMAMGFLSRAQDLGVTTPADISVAGYDGILLGSFLKPQLTTLRTTPRLIAAAAARSLLTLIATGHVADVDLPDVTLDVHGTTGPAPDAR